MRRKRGEHFAWKDILFELLGISPLHLNYNLKTNILWFQYRVWLDGFQFLNHDKVLNFHNRIICYWEPFHYSVKKQRKYQSIFTSLKFKSLFFLNKYANPHYLWMLWNLNFVDFVLTSSFYTLFFKIML